MQPGVYQEDHGMKRNMAAAVEVKVQLRQVLSLGQSQVVKGIMASPYQLVTLLISQWN